MLAVQFKIRHGQLVCDSFQIYRYENEHSVGNINEVVFNEGGVQNSELYFENSNLITQISFPKGLECYALKM